MPPGPPAHRGSKLLARGAQKRAATSCWMPEELKRLLYVSVSASKPVWKACVRTSVLPSRGNRDHILHGWLWACSHAECLSKSNESGAAQNQFLAAAIDCK